MPSEALDTRPRAAKSGWSWLLWPLAAWTGFVLVWWVSVRWSGSKVFPSPAAVLEGVRSLAVKGQLWAYTRDSLWRVLLAFGLSAMVAIPLGLVMGMSPGVARLLQPPLQALRTVSPLAWFPLAILAVGVGNVSAVVVTMTGSVFALSVQVMHAVGEVPRRFLDVGVNFGLSRRRLFRRVLLPAIAPQLVTGLRMALWTSWQVCMAAEMVAVDSGLGYLVFDARNAGQRYSLVVAAMLLIGVVGLVLDVAIRQLERLKFIEWAFLGETK
ncbi:ABC transporter permease [Hyalangium rubrum]|uniref:ABC transporter permease n=1 Tax=Hyalangium rubrum TaxID=3103134 RepID=A0ABU5GYS4_9BACT|nr:ABC transporter permease [Hyalangium sp. s54d21]MDY7225839.1 ABC transporter permease [Hyalangium sp. s54d21]